MTDTVVQEALEKYEYAEARDSEFRELAEDDLRFLSGEQWPANVKKMRESDVENGPRPCLVMDKLNQYVRQVINDARQNRPSIKVRAVEDGDTAVAGIFQGLTRNIEDVSRADIAYDRGLEGAAAIGRGWIRVNTEYSRSDASMQTIRILSIADPLLPLPDPDYKEPDGEDMQFIFLPKDLRKKDYERKYPKATAASGFSAPDGWWNSDYVRVAEYFSVYYDSKQLLTLETGDEVLEDVYAELSSKFQAGVPAIHNSRTIEIPRIKWCKINAFEVLEETEWSGRWIPVVPVHGNEIWVGGERHLFGLIRPGKDPQRLYNYSRSSYAELVALAPKVPFVMAEGQVEGYESEWKKANRVNLSYLLYKPMDIGGHQVPPPQRQPFAGVPAGIMQDMVQAEHDIQSSLGMYAPSIGQPSNERSGKAILARQREGDIGAFHYRDNLSRSIRQIGRIIVDLIPKIYDTRRVLRIVGEDGVESQVIVDPNTQQPVTEIKMVSGEVRKIYNLGIGEYDVTISTGPGYATKREEAANAMLQLTQAAPQLFGIVGDLLVQSMDWPNADEIARRLRLLLPPNLQPEGEGKSIPPEAQAKIAQLTQALQLLTQKTQEIQQEYAKLKGIVDGKVIDKEIKQEDAKVKMQELRVRELEVQLEMDKLVSQKNDLVAETLLKADELDLRRNEGRLKHSQARMQYMQNLASSRLEAHKANLAANELSDMELEPEDELMRSKEVLQALDQIKQGINALAQQVQVLDRRIEMVEATVQSDDSVKQIQDIVVGAQTAAVIPEYNAAGEIVGGTVVQNDGTKRNIDLKRQRS